MTASQLEASAQAPCSSTIVGLGPPPPALVVVAPAEGSWLAVTASPVIARMTAIITRRSLAGWGNRAMSMVFLSEDVASWYVAWQGADGGAAPRGYRRWVWLVVVS